MTRDGTPSISIPEMAVTYHSIHGAVRESVHVFIEGGLHYLLGNADHEPLHIFEVGFGTGLNAFLTALQATEAKRLLHYTAIEPFPLTQAETSELDFGSNEMEQQLFQSLHAAPWNTLARITPHFYFQKIQSDLQAFETDRPFHLVYYDAFAPSAQPQLWTVEVFEKIVNMLLPGGILVTYCAKGDVKRALRAAGFEVKALPGPPGKREMIRAMRRA